MGTKIKICGITRPKEVTMLIENQVDFAGMVMFYPKSKRNNSIENAKILLKKLSISSIQTVAVTVSPTIEQVMEIQALGFDYIQIHNILSKEVLKEIRLPILKAFHISDLGDYENYQSCSKVFGYVFDSAIPGSGETFDWSILDHIPRDRKLFILAGGLNKDNVEKAVRQLRPDIIDVCTGVEGENGKDALKIKELVNKVNQWNEKERKTEMEKYYYGSFGGRYVPESLINTLDELEAAFEEAMNDTKFKEELDYYLKEYVGRETPLYLAERISAKYGTKIYLKREDLNHTGAHKINNVIGQILLAKRMGKKKVIAETGAGQHGVATATGAALFNMECTVYMGEEDIKRQALNVFRMEMLGAKVVSVTSGSNTLKDATNEAIRTWAKTAEDTFYVIGSAVGPYPYPKIVKEFQSIISKEAKAQFLQKEGRLPDTVIACVGGGSNSIGMFANFIEDKEVELIGVEAAGLGVETGKHASAMALGKPGTLHGMRSYLLQDENGNVELAHSISAGLDYPGVGPEHAYLRDTKRVEYVSIKDNEAMDALKELCELEGIIPAIESAHALAYAFKKASVMNKEQAMIVCLSGRGDKDVNTVSDYFSGKGYLN